MARSRPDVVFEHTRMGSLLPVMAAGRDMLVRTGSRMNKHISYRVASARLGMRQLDSEACCHGTATMPRHIQGLSNQVIPTANRGLTNRTCPGSQESSPCTVPKVPTVPWSSLALAPRNAVLFLDASHNSHILVTAFTLPSILHNDDRLRSGESVISQSVSHSFACVFPSL